MKKMLIIVACLFVIACNNESKSESKVTWSDLVSENLKGDIASYEQTPYKVDSMGKMGEVDSCCINVTEYDENGNTIKTISKLIDGTISSESIFTRHPNGQFKSVESTEKGKSTGGFRVDLDADGKIILAVAIDSNGKDGDYYKDINMNEVGEVTGWKQFDKDSVFRAQGEGTYDKHMFLSFTVKDSVGKVKSSSNAKYNDKGEQIEISNTNIGKDSTTTTVTKYTYESHDEMGNWTHRTTWNEKGMATKMVTRKYTYRNSTTKK
ncbi:MAG TPA: hypothetical protein VI548_13800 [Chitinophagaceae bacterium]|nr:hypothetical protein [Chitinophagaceae bacterium]